VSDTQIIELDEPEPAATRVPWRAGSLSIVLAPVVVVALVASLVIPQLADKVTAKPDIGRGGDEIHRDDARHSDDAVRGGARRRGIRGNWQC
jgi:hypothetical protein